MFTSISLINADKVSLWDEMNKCMFKEVLNFPGNMAAAASRCSEGKET